MVTLPLSLLTHPLGNSLPRPIQVSGRVSALTSERTAADFTCPHYATLTTIGSEDPDEYKKRGLYFRPPRPLLRTKGGPPRNRPKLGRLSRRRAFEAHLFALLPTNISVFADGSLLGNGVAG